MQSLSLWSYLLFGGGLVLLIVGAEALVRGSSRLAAAIGISPLIIGLTVVAFGTSAPELAVSVKSALSGEADIALGNVVGSNIFNVLAILGLSALVAPLMISQQLIRLDVPIMIIASLLVYFFSFDGIISRFEGLILFLGIVLYTVFLIRISKKESKAVKKEFEEYVGPFKNHKVGRTAYNIFLGIFGLILLIIGAKWLVESAVTISRVFGVSELIIGLTVVAAGTSLPEVATSLVASMRGQRDIAVGNVVGSCIFNIFSVLGLSSLLSASGIVVNEEAFSFAIPIMIATALICLPIFFSGHTIRRTEGALLLGYYVAYTSYLILKAQENHFLGFFNDLMLFLVIPLTVLTVILFSLFDLRRIFVKK